MKYLICSDIHGSYYYTNRVIEYFNRIRADRIIILGDILYHGPRNPFPREYNCMKVVELLNQYKDKIIAVRGNCDAEIDQQLLEFDNSKDFTRVAFANGRELVLSHGHIYNPKNLPPRTEKGDIFLYGHIHVPTFSKKNGITCFNPGSCACPKNNHEPSFAILDENSLKYYIIRDDNTYIVKTITNI